MEKRPAFEVVKRRRDQAGLTKCRHGIPKKKRFNQIPKRSKPDTSTMPEGLMTNLTIKEFATPPDYLEFPTRK